MFCIWLTNREEGIEINDGGKNETESCFVPVLKENEIISKSFIKSPRVCKIEWRHPRKPGRCIFLPKKNHF
jgi:hypothetical protein